MKFAPLMAMLKPGLPAGAEPGFMLLIAGAGVAGALTWLMVNGSAFDEPLSRLKTLTLAVPGAVMFKDEISALSWVAEMTTVD